MRADRPLLTVLTILAVLALGYFAYTISAAVRPGPAPPASAGHDRDGSPGGQ